MLYLIGAFFLGLILGAGFAARERHDKPEPRSTRASWMPTPHAEHAAAKLERAIAASTIAEPELERQLGDLRAMLSERAAQRTEQESE